MTHYKLILLALLSILHLSLQASVEIRSERLTTSNGLADNSIRYIYQDNKGFLWLATLNGLSRYDGTSFVNFYPQENKQLSLADHRIKSLAEDRHGFLWITTYADIFSCYDLKKDCFVDFTGCGKHNNHYRNILLADDVWLWGKAEGCIRISFHEGTFTSETFGTHNQSLPTDNINFIKESTNGSIYIGTEKGLFCWCQGKLNSIQPDIDFRRALFYQDHRFFVSTEGKIWMPTPDNSLQQIGEIPLQEKKSILTGILRLQTSYLFFTSSGSFSFDWETHRIVPVHSKLNIPNGVVNTDNRGNYWVHNRTGNLYYINAKTTEIKEFPLMLKEDIGFVDREQYHIVHDSRNIIWISTYGNGLFAYDPSTQQLQQFTADDNRTAPIGSNFLQNIIEDRSGSLWVSSEFSGVSHLSVINEGAIRLYPEKGKNTNRLNAIRMITKTQNENIWIGTRSGGLFLYNTDLSIQQARYYRDINTYAIQEDPNGVKWIGTRGTGLYIEDQHYVHNPSDSSSLAHNAIFCILKDRKGRMWIGTFGGGLDLAIPGKNGYTFRHFFDGQYGQRWVRCLIEDRNGWIWAGTSGGVFVFHPDRLIENAHDYYGYDYANKALKSNEIRCIMEDHKGRVWIAEPGTGFCVCTPHTDYDQLSFTHYNISHGLVSSMVQSFAEDAQGLIWISTEYGMSCFTPETETFENYFFSDLMLGNVYCENSAITLKDGRLAFGSHQGLVIINPAQVERNRNTASITFTDLKLNGISTRPGDFDSPLPSALAYAPSIQLKHYQNSFAIEFSTFDYSGTDLSKFSYKLENYEDKWSVPSTLNFAAYKNLSPGTYRLHVKACNAAGVWGNREAVLRIVVLPPFWKTWWAFLVYLILAILTFYIIFRTVHNINSLRNKIKIEEQLTEYKLVFFTNVSHEFRTPLTLIQGALEKIQNSGKLSKEVAHAVKVMDKSTQRLLRLINQLIEFRKMQHNKLSLSLEEMDVIAFLYDIYLSFQDAAQAKHITFNFVSSVPSYYMYIDRDKVDKSAYNLLSNALKYTPANGKVELHAIVDKVNRKLIVKVTDTGVGIPREKRNELFKRFMQSSFSSDSMGVGLHLTHELMNVHKGSIVYEENPEGGSIFILTFPTDASVYGKEDFLVPIHALLQENNMETPVVVPVTEIPMAEEAVIGSSATNPSDAGTFTTQSSSTEAVLAPSSLSEVKKRETERQNIRALEDTPVIPLNKQRILLIEDDTDVRSFLADALGVFFDVITAPDGTTGLQQACTCEPDLIISDVLMPGYSGFEVTKRLKSDFSTSHIPIILLTALSAPENHLQGVECGADAYITKPFSMKLLLASVSKLMEQREKLREKFTKDPNSVHATISVTEKDKEFADKLLLVMESQLSNPKLSVDDLASIMGMGRTVFYSKVRGVTGYSPAEYMRIMRMKKAAQLLLSGQYTVAEISYKVGINDPFYFSKCFKNQFGVSPSVYQKGKREEEV